MKSNRVPLALAGALTLLWSAAHGVDQLAISPEQSRQVDEFISSQDLGIPADDLARYVAGQDEFAALVDELQREMPDGFVDAEWDGPNSRGTYIAVRPDHYDAAVTAAKASAPSATPRILVSYSVPATTRSEAEYDLVDQTARLTNGDQDVSATIDPKTNQATITVMTRPATSARQARSGGVSPEHVEQQLELPEFVKSASVEFTAKDSGPEFGSGGNWNGNSCTAGFTAVRGGRTAVTTTTHCGSASRYDGATLSARSVSTAREGDVQSFLAAGVSNTNSLRYDWGKHRRINRSYNPVRGNVVCHFGIATGHGCSEVTSTGRAFYFGGIKKTVGNLVYVRGHITSGGDSGGPWFWSDRAHGIHMGNCGGSSCFTAISSLSKISTRVYTG